MRLWLALLRAFEFLLLLANTLMRERMKEEGRQEVRAKQKEADEKAAKDAAEIDAVIRGSDIDELRKRLRHHQRPD